MPDAEVQAQRTDRFDLRALYETSRLLSASLELEFVLNNLLLTAMSKLLVTRGVAMLYEPLEYAYRVANVKGFTQLPIGDLIRIEGLPADRMLRDDAVPDPLRKAGVSLLLPVAFGHREIGLIGLGPKATRQPFESRELEFILSLVNMSSAAVHNSLIVQELQLANRDLDAKIQQLNTLFDLSQEFNATIDRKRLVKLLSFALMGQMLVSKHLFLLRRSGTDAETDQKTRLQVVSSKGIHESALDADLMDALCDLKELLLLQDTPTNGTATAPTSPALAPLRHQGLTLALPIYHQGQTCAVLCLGPKMTGQPYQADDIDLLSALGNLAYVSIQNSYLVEEQIEKERLEEEMRLARDIQKGLLPQEIPTFPGLDIAALALPSQQVGGDYFDVIPLEYERILVSIADVTGKGVPAALLMANLQACLQIMVPMDLTIEEATSHMNRVVCDNTGYDKFITAFSGIYRASDRRFEYVNAGHNPPMLLRTDGSLELLETGGLLLGVMKDMPYERGTVNLAPGDVLTLFTDGVTEAMSPADEEYGEERLEQILRAHAGASAGDILEAVHKDIIDFTGSATRLSDDLTMIVIKAVAVASD